MTPTGSAFHGLSAFPITPADDDGAVDTDLLTCLLERIVEADADSIGLLGSTGTYAYLSREESRRATEAAVECVDGRLPLIISVGALRTDDAQSLARDAEAAGADALLLAPVSYTPLTDEEAYQHYRTVAGSTGLPLCVYSNPATTPFSFSQDLFALLSEIDNIRAVKLPALKDDDFARELKLLRERTDFDIGYSADWTMALAFKSGADAFYSVIAGMMPKLGVSLARASRSGKSEEACRIDDLCQPLWGTFKAYGSLRVMYVLLDLFEIGQAELPRPLLPLNFPARQRIEEALEPLAPFR